MHINKTSSLLLVAGAAFIIIAANITDTGFEASTKLIDVYKELDEPMPSHYIEQLDETKIKSGKELIFQGWTYKSSKKKSKLISKHFVCTDCHNTVIEDPDLSEPNPETRLDFAIKNKLPFLQGTTFYGVVNRVHWYNGDYLKKYGALVENARDTLVNAIQLCAKECSQGRYLEDWEVENILHYFWSIQFDLKDLKITEEERDKLKNSKNYTNQEKIDWLKTRYFLASPATFLNVQTKDERKMGKDGDATKGKAIYDLSCLHCHGFEKDVADLKLDYARNTFKQFKKNLKKDNDFTLYKIVRKGTPPDVGYRPYMPHFTKERLSEQQLEDLVAYILSEL